MSENYNYSNFREWMYKRMDEKMGNFSKEFIAGVDQLMTFANSQPTTQSNGGNFLCPCSVCKNDKIFSGVKNLETYMYSRWFMRDYYDWYNHGEKIDMTLGTSHVDLTPLIIIIRGCFDSVIVQIIHII